MTHEMYCKDAGAASCRGHVKADDLDEFKAKLLTHLDKKHGVKEPNDTLVDYLMRVTEERSTSS
ncbi:MAG: DUF1059 domain-containing protein [Actinomycetota bacterium]|nr:DUF1059 domain-containing protein [Actinomycetota bacterium]